MDEQNNNEQNPYFGNSTSNGDNNLQQSPYYGGNTGNEQNGFGNQNYGQPYNAYSEPVQKAQNGGSNTLGIVGMILGILSIPTGCCYGIGIVFSIAGLICSLIGNKKNKSGFGVAGIITSIVGILISLIMIICIVYLFSSGMFEEILDEYGYYYY